MNDREKIYQLLDVVPDYKAGYVVAYLQGLTDGEDVKPNKETLEAFAEVDNMKHTGSGPRFHNLDDLWSSLEDEEC